MVSGQQKSMEFDQFTQAQILTPVILILKPQ